MQLNLLNKEEDVIRVSVAGRITQDRLAESPKPLDDVVGEDFSSSKVVLDMGQAEYLDSSGVNWLLGMHRKLDGAGGRLVLCNLPQVVSNIIKVLHLHSVLNLANGEEEIAQQLGGETA